MTSTIQQIRRWPPLRKLVFIDRTLSISANQGSTTYLYANAHLAPQEKNATRHEITEEALLCAPAVDTDNACIDFGGRGTQYEPTFSKNSIIGNA